MGKSINNNSADNKEKVSAEDIFVAETETKQSQVQKSASVSGDQTKAAESTTVNKKQAKAAESKKAGEKQSKVQQSAPVSRNQTKAEGSTAVNRKQSQAAESTTASNVSEEVSESQSKKKSKNKGKKKLPSVIIPVAAAVIVLSAGVVVSASSLGLFNTAQAETFAETPQSNSALSNPVGRFVSGISVEGVDLGGRTMEEAQDVLCIAESELIPSINYTLTCNDKILYLTEDDFEYNFDTVQVLNKAFEYSEYMRRTVTQEGRTELKDSEKKDFAITCTFNSDSIQTVCDAAAEKVNVQMQNAHATKIDVSKDEISDMFTFAEGITGYSLDVDDLKTQITTLLNKETYTADIIGQMEVIEPTYTIKDLKKNLVLISMYTTYSTNTWAGNNNMDTAFKSMNGSIIKDGEIFSFNEKTGNSNLTENGYAAAGVIVSGRSATGVGGGICQAATTIYNAAIRADMTIIEREPHTWPSTYVPVGTDAAIDYGNIDMKFQNNTGHEVYLICYMDGGTLYSYIYGYKPNDFDEITVSSWLTGSTGSGFGAAASRSYIKDGEVTKTEDLFSSYYSNGGGTSYASSEAPSGYVFKRVFTDEQIAADEKKASEKKDGKETSSKDNSSDKEKTSSDTASASDKTDSSSASESSSAASSAQ